MSGDQTMRLTQNDLFSPKVDGYLEEQDVLRRHLPEASTQPLVIRVIYSSYFYLSLAGALGALCGWAVIEPFFFDREIGHGFHAAQMLLFPTVAAAIGLFL